MSVAADSLLNLIENTRNINMRKAWVDTILVESLARRPDYDMAAAMNLLFRLPDKEPLAYPVFKFEENAEEKDYPMVLTVGDSYFWNIFNTRIPAEVFKNQAFWYFGTKVYPDTYYNPTSVKDLDIKKEVEKQDVIFLMTTERFLYKFEWKFVDKLFDIYGPTSSYDKVYYYIADILSTDDWFKNIIEKAERKNITIEEMLILDAKYVYRVQEPENYNVFYGVKELEEKIRKDENWMKVISQKANDKNISLDDMITLDAEYEFSKNSPEACAIYHKIKDYKQQILKDPTFVEKVESDAAFYRISFDEMLQISAENMMQ